MRTEEREEGKNENLTTAELASVEGGARRESKEEQMDSSSHRQSDKGGLQPLLPSDMTQKFQQRWDELQIKFVDDPRTSVAEADQLVAELMKNLAGTFACEREGLENQWSKGENISTEDLRVTLRRYRSFFERFLSI